MQWGIELRGGAHVVYYVVMFVRVLRSNSVKHACYVAETPDKVLVLTQICEYEGQ